MLKRSRIAGSCRENCAACCKVLGVPWPARGDLARFRIDVAGCKVTIPYPSDEMANFAYFLSVRGATFDDGARTCTVPFDDTPNAMKLTSYGPSQTRVLMLKSRCPQLREDNTCALHGTPELPKTCQLYPTPLDDLLPECSYTKEPVDG